MRMSKFPEHFIWGGASSAAGTEGGYRAGGRGLSLQDYLTAGDARSPRKATWKDKFGNSHASPSLNFSLPAGAEYCLFDEYYYPSHNAVNFFEHWKEDLDLLQKLGLKMYRISISWSRLFPTGREEEPSEEGIEFYRQIFTELRNRGIEPMVTLWNNDSPASLIVKEKGWKTRDMIDLFVWYAGMCFQAFKGLVHWWIPFHEINNALQVFDFSKDSAILPWQEACQGLHYQMVASAEAIRIGHAIDPDNKIGCMLCAVPYYPLTPDPKDFYNAVRAWQQNLFYTGDVLLKGRYPVFSRRIWQEHVMDLDMTEQDIILFQNNTADFLAFSYHTSSTITTHPESLPVKAADGIVKGEVNPYLEYTSWDWASDPQGLETFCELVWDRYEKPMFLAENGMANEDVVEDGEQIHDSYRIDFMARHLEVLSRCIHYGADIRGYMISSPIDSVSMRTGQMSKRFGVVYVDLDDFGKGTQKRIPKDSYSWYRKVIETNGQYLDEIKKQNDMESVQTS